MNDPVTAALAHFDDPSPGLWTAARHGKTLAAEVRRLLEQRCETCQSRAHDEFDLSRGGPDWCLKHDRKCSAIGFRCGAWARRET